jgi:hypothetical protein
MGVHGGIDETSLLLHLRPELVDLAAGFRNVPDDLRRNRLRAFRRPGQLRVAVERLRPERPHRRSDGVDARARQSPLRSGRRGSRGVARRVRAFTLPRADAVAVPELRVDGARLLRRLAALGEISPIEEAATTGSR